MTITSKNTAKKKEKKALIFRHKLCQCLTLYVDLKCA